LSRIDFVNILKNNNSKVISFEESNLLNHRDFNLVFTNGCFDFGLTSAHIDCLTFAKKQGDKLVVGINTDESIRRLKGRGRPIMSLCERIKLLSSLEFVDYIVPFDQDTPLQLIESIRPSIIVKGGDYKKEDVVGNNLAEVRIFNFIENNLSTTEKIIKAYEAMKINSGD
jgi:D-beta-D-heptose 7-phosphate kinase/D-beta-D-heptose 1-phosphate adenosyltransferase